jgi:hypothetical protein
MTSWDATESYTSRQAARPSDQTTTLKAVSNHSALANRIRSGFV